MWRARNRAGRGYVSRAADISLLIVEILDISGADDRADIDV